MRDAGIAGEIIVADNGSTDGSQDIATPDGRAASFTCAERGYGNALMGGIAAARGKFIIMGDADDSYDFLELPKFVEQLRAGLRPGQGCRFPRAAARVLPGAMPLLHRWWGNPMFSRDGAAMVLGARSTTSIAACADSRKTCYDALDQRCTGMEFATEMIIKSSLPDARIAEVPITLHPDGRKAHAPHLKTFRDGWRTLRFFLMYSPRWLFLYPVLRWRDSDSLATRSRCRACALAGVHFDAHTLLFASLAMLLGHQAVIFAIFAKTFAIVEGLLPPNRRMERVLSYRRHSNAVCSPASHARSGPLLSARP